MWAWCSHLVNVVIPLALNDSLTHPYLSTFTYSATFPTFSDMLLLVHQRSPEGFGQYTSNLESINIELACCLLGPSADLFCFIPNLSNKNKHSKSLSAWKLHC